VAVGFARIHRQNLPNFGVLPLTFSDPSDAGSLTVGDVLHLEGLHDALRRGGEVTATVGADGRQLGLRHDLSPREVDVVITGGLLNWMKQRLASHP
jgi:aconitate hydratase